jgi:hypothetical protein
MSPVKYELGFYIPEDDILHSHCRENLKAYMFHMYQSSVTAPFQARKWHYFEQTKSLMLYRFGLFYFSIHRERLLEYVRLLFPRYKPRALNLTN